MTIKNIFKASLFHSIHYGKIEFLKDAVITVLENGIINEVIKNIWKGKILWKKYLTIRGSGELYFLRACH